MKFEIQFKKTEKVVTRAEFIVEAADKHEARELAETMKEENSNNLGWAYTSDPHELDIIEVKKIKPIEIVTFHLPQPKPEPLVEEAIDQSSLDRMEGCICILDRVGFCQLGRIGTCECQVCHGLG